MELLGPWRATVADDDLRRVYAEPDHDDSSWSPVPVPGHWRGTADFADGDGPLLYRTSFEAPDPAAIDLGAGRGWDEEGRRWWLTFDGVFYQSDVWMDGAYLGDTEGYFAPHTFDVTEMLTARRDHVLAVEVTCAPQRDKAAKRNLTGVFQHSDDLPAGWNPGGIWRPVRLSATGPVRIRDLRVLCTDATAERAVVVVRANLESAEARNVVVRSHVGANDHELTRSLAAGENHVEWTITVPAPRLWWPWSLGDQPLHDVEVTVEVDGRASHTRRARTGLRTVSVDRWRWSVNGERLFVKGINLHPTRPGLADATGEQAAAQIALAREAGLDLVRVRGHIGRPELYHAADTAGMLVWQDLPLHRAYSRGVRKQAVRQAAQAVAVLGHHPSIALWCGHSEPVPLEAELDVATDAAHLGDDTSPASAADPTAASPGRRRLPRFPVRPRRTVGQALRTGMALELPSWNRSILDRSVKRALAKADGTRPVVASCGVLPHAPTFEPTARHLSFGWRTGAARDLEELAAAVPAAVSFVSEFGAAAVPPDAGFLQPERWPDLDWHGAAADHGLDLDRLDRVVPGRATMTFERWQAATQAHQAAVLRHHVETLRRLKYRPAGGFAALSLQAPHPAVSTAVVDHAGNRTPAYQALVEACAPVLVVADLPPERVVPGEAVALDVHVVSDLRTSIERGLVTAVVTGGGEPLRWEWTGDLQPDSVTHVGTVRFSVPETPAVIGAEIVVDLELTGAVVARNRYRTVVASRH